MVGPNAAKLALPATWKVHNVFHVSLLQPFVPRPGASPDPKLPMLDDNNEPWYRVDKILSHRERKIRKKVVKEYLIKWLGYSDEHNSYEPAANISPDLLHDYHSKIALRSN